MEASDGVIRGNVESLTKLITALQAAGIAFIAENAPSPEGGRGIRLTRPKVVYPDFTGSKPPYPPVNAA
jgi:hypothetical protein